MQFFLGVMYGTGEGVPQDYAQAHMWLNLAANHPSGEEREETVEGRDLVAGRMTAEQVTEAQRLASEWTAAHPREP